MTSSTSATRRRLSSSMEDTPRGMKARSISFTSTSTGRNHLLNTVLNRNIIAIGMKTSKNNTPIFRRNFLAFIAGTAGTLGITASFGNTSSGKGQPKGKADGNVRNFGAKGDGRTDDSAAVQAAVDAGSGSVFFPKGVYRITKTIEVPLNRIGLTSVRSDGSSQIIMAGSGPAFRIIGTHSKSADPKGFSDEVWDRQRMPVIDNLAIVGDHGQAVGIEAAGTMQL